MKLIIAGSRSLMSLPISRLIAHINVAIAGLTTTMLLADRDINVTEVVSGGAPGPDRAGESWAAQRGIQVTQFLPNWNKYERGAGVIRNRQMGEYADAAVILWDGKSGGSRNMFTVMQSLDKPCNVITIKE